MHFDEMALLYIPVSGIHALSLTFPTNKMQFKDPKLCSMNYHLCSGKKCGQLLVPNSSDCPNTIAQSASDQARYLLI